MTVAQLDVVDFIATKPETNEIALIIADHLKWDEPHHIDTLKSKVNAYIDYINSADFTEAYPDAKEKNVVIELLSAEEPNSAALDAFASIERLGSDMNFRFTHRVERS